MLIRSYTIHIWHMLYVAHSWKRNKCFIHTCYNKAHLHHSVYLNVSSYEPCHGEGGIRTCADSVAPNHSALQRSLNWEPHWPLLSRVGFSDLSADSEALGSDCADVQTDLKLHCPHNYVRKLLSRYSSHVRSQFVNMQTGFRELTENAASKDLA